MKRIITTASIAALGAVGLQAAYAPVLTSQESSKWWSVSLALRGFYEDNYTTLPSNLGKRDSFGVVVSPSVEARYVADATMASLGYTYGMYWYEDRDSNSADHTHQIDARLNHAFSDSYRLDVSDSFVISQEPAIQGGGQRIRINGNNIRNLGNIVLTGDFTPTLGFDIGYANNLYNYDDKKAAQYTYLDRIEHYPHLNLRYRVSPQTVALLGYQYGFVDHTNDGDPSWINVIGPADSRNARIHYFYAGVDHGFTSDLVGALRLGAQNIKYPDADQAAPGLPITDDSRWAPYADASLSYTYMAGSVAKLGVRYTRQESEYMQALDEQATTVYGDITHKLTAKLTGKLLVQYTHASFNEGIYDDDSEDYVVVGLNLAYQINQYLAADVGYNFDDLSSDVTGRSYDRNRVYVGLIASY